MIAPVVQQVDVAHIHVVIVADSLLSQALAINQGNLVASAKGPGPQADIITPAGL